MDNDSEFTTGDLWYLEELNKERSYQTQKHGSLKEHGHSTLEWIRIAIKKLNDAEKAWYENTSDNNALIEVFKAAAVLKACAEQHGIFTRKDRL